MDHLAASLARLGVPPEQVAQFKDDQAQPAEDEPAESLGLWAMNLPAFRLFKAMSTQWHFVVDTRSGTAYYEGLHYSGLGAVAQALKLELTENLLSELRTMERAGAACKNGVPA